MVRFRLIQNERGKAVVELIRGRNYSSADSTKIINELSHRSGRNVEFELKFVEKIELSPRNKFSFIVNNLIG